MIAFKVVRRSDGLVDVMRISDGVIIRHAVDAKAGRAAVAHANRSISAKLKQPKPTSQNAGYISSLRTGAIGEDGKRGIVTLYIAELQAIPESDGGKYAAVCESHGTLCQTPSKSMGRHLIKVPWDWCDECRDAAEKAGEVTFTPAGQYDEEVMRVFKGTRMRSGS